MDYPRPHATTKTLDFQGRLKMRSFVSSAIIIATVLIGQQWVAKANAEQTRPSVAMEWAMKASVVQVK